MTKEEFIGQLDRAAMTVASLPVSSAMVQYLSAELKKGDPAWWKGTAKAWEKRTFSAWSEPWGLFLTAVHFEALNDGDNPLVPYFPSCGGTDEADPSGALEKFLAGPPASFYENLKHGHRRSYVQARAPIWIAPSVFFFHKRRLPYYIVEVNAGAGLNIAADVVSPIREAKKKFNSGLIAARIGLDPKPLQLDDISHLRWLTAGVLPDNRPGIADLDRAVEIVRARQKEEAAFIQLVACAPQSGPKFIAKNIPADDPDVGLLVMNMATTGRMTDAEYEAYSKDMTAMLLPWGDRALWVEIESVRGEMYSTTIQVSAHRVIGGVLQRCVMVSIDMNANKGDFVKESEAFLTVAPPAKKK